MQPEMVDEVVNDTEGKVVKLKCLLCGEYISASNPSARAKSHITDVANQICVNSTRKRQKTTGELGQVRSSVSCNLLQQCTTPP